MGGQRHGTSWPATEGQWEGAKVGGENRDLELLPGTGDRFVPEESALLCFEWQEWEVQALDGDWGSICPGDALDIAHQGGRGWRLHSQMLRWTPSLCGDQGGTGSIW